MMRRRREDPEPEPVVPARPPVEQSKRWDVLAEWLEPFRTHLPPNQAAMLDQNSAAWREALGKWGVDVSDRDTVYILAVGLVVTYSASATHVFPHDPVGAAAINLVAGNVAAILSTFLPEEVEER